MTRILEPAGWKKPSGYSNGVEAQGRTVFVAGQVGWGPDALMVGDDLVSQTRQALRNIEAVLACAGAGVRDITRLTWYVLDLDEYRRERRRVGEVYREVMGDHYPAMSLVQVAGLVEEGARVEIEATAVIASPPSQP
ncbi:MAG TPA: RidA family protein [Candidatus Krumholzibacteria bacterium]|nr:RidA family protein [Candidatus Krumholzibacteria bacterium]